MQKIIGMVGYVNKTELIINLAKVLKLAGKSVLVIDATKEERMRSLYQHLTIQKKNI